MTISTIWNALEVARKCELDPRNVKVKQWFARWYTQKNKFSTAECREMLYPCYIFDHAKGFAVVSKQLVYNVPGHIEERRPEGFGADHPEHRLPNQRIIGEFEHRRYVAALLIRHTGAINGARGSIKNKIHSGLYDSIAYLIDRATCERKEHVLWTYGTALQETGAWPVFVEASRKSINELLGLLDEFSYEDPHLGRVCPVLSGCHEISSEGLSAL